MPKPRLEVANLLRSTRWPECVLVLFVKCQTLVGDLGLGQLLNQIGYLQNIHR